MSYAEVVKKAEEYANYNSASGVGTDEWHRLKAAYLAGAQSR
jgi:hypothetical protein